MPRYRQVFDKELNKHVLVEIGQTQSPSGHFVRGDTPDFVSPIDGTIVNGAKGMREHCEKHGVVPVREFDENHMARKRKERERLYTGERTRAETLKNRQQIHEIINRLERR